MPSSIRLSVAHPELPEGRIQGFHPIWAFYVDGFRLEGQCQECLKGDRVPEFISTTAQSGRTIELDRMDRYPFVYICGVAMGATSDRQANNLHLALQFETGSVVELTTYNGYRVRAENARRMPIPALQDGWQGRPLEQTRCKNYQFGVAYFGGPEDQTQAAVTVDTSPAFRAESFDHKQG
jgi:hypothetical protein